MIRLLPILILLISIFSGGLNAQKSEAETVLNKIQKITKKRSLAQVPLDNKIYYFKNKMKIVYWDRDNTPSLTQNVEIKISKNQLQYLADEIEMYQDRTDLFVVVHLSKTIMQSVSRFDEMFTKDVKGVEILDEAFFKMTKNISLKKYTTKSGKSIDKLTINMDTAAQSLYHLEKVICHYDSENEKLLMTDAFFCKNYKYKKQTIWYKIENYDYSGKLEKKVLNYIFDKKGNLLPRYKEYEYINDKDF